MWCLSFNIILKAVDLFMISFVAVVVKSCLSSSLSVWFHLKCLIITIAVELLNFPRLSVFLGMWGHNTCTENLLERF